MSGLFRLMAREFLFALWRKCSFTHWPFDRKVEFYLLIDQQIGGNWPGQVNPAELKAKSANFDIDYVRVYSTPEYKFTPTKKKKSKNVPSKAKVKKAQITG